MRITIPKVGNSAVSEMQPILIAAFANTSTYGHGMKVAPHARFDDGQFDICLVHDMNKFKLLCLSPTIYFGRHLSIPGVEHSRAAKLKLETINPCDVYADGEYVCQTPIEVSVASAALPVIVP